MRVISGKAKSLRLKTIEGMDTRPTQDRIKETLFNMISSDVGGCVFLDLFSGSGGIGIEALSRGAKQAVFVEKSAKAMSCIKENLRFTKLEKDAKLMQTDAVTAIRQLDGSGILFDYIFMDPPYGKLLEKDVLEALMETDLYDEKTVIIVESDLKTDYDYLEGSDLEVYRVKKYKTNKHTFIWKVLEEEE
ncbi:MAG: 16S rRNA (guanine(966)-N(2))-methyltransferase RsmD [Lachnospiraceae bacterium]|nr:16S rRNA (guanine(966)-N(2))-methyltransferase RsmD [Lachnospiraceae bacterium]